jgi:hypothetical protein
MFWNTISMFPVWRAYTPTYGMMVVLVLFCLQADKRCLDASAQSKLMRLCLRCLYCASWEVRTRLHVLIQAAIPLSLF